MKKAIFAVFSLIFLLLIYAVVHVSWIEPSWFEVTETDIVLPPERKLESSLKILHLSDFHDGDSVSYSLIEKAVDIGIKEKPDIIFLTGDFWTWTVTDIEVYAKILRKLSKTAPTFACQGNHDGGRWAAKGKGYKDIFMLEKLLKDSNIILLVNQSSDIEIRGTKLRIVGLGDLWAKNIEQCKAFQENNNDPATPVLLLSHNPDSKDYLLEFVWDIMFCGHTHGGQLALPVIGRPFLPVIDHDFAEGLHFWNQRNIYITRGVGNLHGKRLNCRPEISIITLKSL